MAATASEDGTTGSRSRTSSISSLSTASSAQDAWAASLFSHAPALVARELQQLTRQRRRFAEFEAGLPDMLSQLRGEAGESGPAGPAGSARASSRPITAQDTVWLQDNVAYGVDTAAGRGWQAEYVVAVLSQQATGRVVSAVAAVRAVAAAVAGRLGGGGAVVDAATLQTIGQRLRPFVQDVLPGRQVHVRHGGDWPLVLAATGGDGLSSQALRLPDDVQAGALVASTADVPAGVAGELSMQTRFAEGTGWGVISDIDDTIKITQTGDPVGILQTTFVDEPTPVAGMPELYGFLASATASDATAAAPFFYLSASPYNLYPFLRRFRQQHYPHGALLLRHASPMSVAGLLSTLTLDTQDYKVGRMRTVHDWLPHKTFVCVGDSTQSDPEAYGEIYRSFPGWVGLILIRKVTDIAALGMAEKNEPARFEKAFHDMPTSAWLVFEDPAECYAHVRRVVGGEAKAATAAAATAAAAAAAAAATMAT